jgi:hypothetical protein
MDPLQYTVLLADIRPSTAQLGQQPRTSRSRGHIRALLLIIWMPGHKRVTRSRLRSAIEKPDERRLSDSRLKHHSNYGSTRRTDRRLESARLLGKSSVDYEQR